MEPYEYIHDWNINQKTILKKKACYKTENIKEVIFHINSKMHQILVFINMAHHSTLKNTKYSVSTIQSWALKQKSGNL